MDLQTKLSSNYYITAQNKAYTDFKGKDGVAGRGDRDRYNLEDTAVRTEFRKDLEDEYGVTMALGCAALSQDKADTLFNLAWDYGHSSGYQDVDTYYSELVELVL